MRFVKKRAEYFEFRVRKENMIDGIGILPAASDRQIR